MEIRVAESLSFSLKNPVRIAVIDSLVPLLKDNLNFTKELENIKKELTRTHTFKDLQTEMRDWKRRPYDILANGMIGCCKQCPFCKAKCEHINPDHPGDHRVSMHRPLCLANYRWSDSQVILDSCADLVISESTFRNEDTNNKHHPYKRYREIYKDWLIIPHGSRYDSSYWKYFIAQYVDEILWSKETSSRERRRQDSPRVEEVRMEQSEKRPQRKL